MAEEWLDTHDGIRLCYHAWPCPGEPERAVVVIAHGLGEHGGRYAPLAETLHHIGCSVYAPDHRGHGRSGGQRGHVERFDDWVDDLAQMVRLVMERHRHRPLFMIGHSGGGLIVLRYLVHQHAEHVRGMILSSPLLGIAVPIPPLKLRLGRLLASVIPRLTLRSGVDPVLVSHDQTLVNRYASDPLVHDRISLRLFRELEDTMATALRDAGRITPPALILQAGDDRIVSVAATKRLYAQLSSTDKTLTIYDGWFHEVFNEVERQRVFEEVAQWIERHLGPAAAT